jgi:pilus assembly protein CpaF
LEALASAAGLDRAALHSQVASGLRLAVHLCRDAETGRRRVAEVYVLDRGADGLVRAQPAWCWDGGAAQGTAGPGHDRLGELLGVQW